MGCACGNNPNNISTLITKKVVIVRHLFNQKTRDERIKILKDYINSKPIHVKNDIQFQINMVKLYKSIVSV